MNVEELSMIGPPVDLQTVESIHKKRLLAFINHFVINTSLFLNKLSKSCEQRFMQLDNKIQKLEASIVILESKLNSVPGLDVEKTEEVVAVTELTPVKVEEMEDKTFEGEVPTETEVAQPVLDPAYMKYVKMLQFGVPEPAVRLKMTQEGVDPSLHQDILNHK